MEHSVFMSELDSFTYRELIQDNQKVLIIPVGAVEQHGPHMSMNVDILLPTKIAENIAINTNALVAPTITYGYKSQQRSGGGNHLIGTTSLDGATLVDVAKTLIKDYYTHGFRKFVFINGHYENNYFLIEGIDLALRELKWENATDAKVMNLSYWDFVTEDVIADIYPNGFLGWDIEHGGVMETSLMLYYYPELVNMGKIDDIEPAKLNNYDIYPVDPSLTPDSGCLSSAKEASVVKGEILATNCINRILLAVNKEFNQ